MNHANRMSLIVCATLLMTACTPRNNFPQNFQFGSAIAGFQVEMGCPTTAASECEDRNSDWYAFITTPEIVNDAALYITGDPPTAGPGFYELYPQDLDRAASELNNNALRTSIEWSRIFPNPTFGVTDPAALQQLASPTALAYYHALFAAMRQRGLRPLITLNHYSLPLWMHDVVACHADLSTCTARGWLDDRIVGEIAKYAAFAAREFGGEVDLWATLNEPLTAVAVAGYVLPTPTRSNPPGLSLRFAEGKQATLNMITAHARMYDAVKTNDTMDADGDGNTARVGLVYNLTDVQPADPNNTLDAQGARNMSYLLNELFLDAVAQGQIDVNFDGNQQRRDDLVGRMDYIGLNYYTRMIVTGTTASQLPQLSSLITVTLESLQNFDYDYPRGLYNSINLARTYGLPIIITETGFEDPQDTGSAARWAVETLTWVSRAIREGAPIEGYYYWTLMDNYEWNHGADIRLGLYAVDKNDPQKQRRARKSALAYGRIARARAIPEDLSAAYPLR